MIRNEFPKYLYLHKNGNIIEKTVRVCETNTTPEEYFSGPNVLEYAKIFNREEDVECRQRFEEEYNAGHKRPKNR